MPPHATIRKQQPQERKQTPLAAAPPALEHIRVRSWKKLPDAELVSIARAFIESRKIRTRFELGRTHGRLYRELSRRRLLDEAGLKIASTSFTKLPDSELLSLARRHISEEKITGRFEFKKKHTGLYGQLSERDLLPSLPLKAKADWVHMEKGKIIQLAQKLAKEEKISSLTEFQTKHACIYRAIRARGFLDSIGISRKSFNWRALENEEVASLAREKMKELGISGRKQFKDAEPGHYKVLSQRGLLGKVGFSQNHTRWRDLSDGELLAETDKFRKKTGACCAAEFSETKEGARLYGALRKRGLVRKAGIRPRLMRWSRMERGDFISRINWHCEKNEVWSLQDLKNRFQKIYQAVLARAKKDNSVLSEIGITRKFAEMKRKETAGQVNLKIATFDWKSLSDRQLVKFANFYIEENDILLAIELRKKFNRLYRELAKRANRQKKAEQESRTPGLWEKIDLIRKKDAEHATSTALLRWAGKCASANGIRYFSELKGRHRCLYGLLEGRNLLSRTSFINYREKVITEEEKKEGDARLKTAKGLLLDSVNKGEPWEVRNALKMFNNDSERRHALRATDKAGRAPLLIAVSRGDSPTASILIENGAEVDSRSPDGTTSFMAAVSKGHLRLARFLQLKGAEIDSKDDLGWTQLMWSARKGTMEQVSLLLELGADPSLRDPDGLTASKIAEEFGHTEVALKILEKTKKAGSVRGGLLLRKAAALLE